jgi:TrpR-related protein YerC/YecD
MAQRMQVATMLKKRRTYIDIAHTTGASTATISRVNRSLSYGNDGYKMVFERMSQKKQEEE